MNERRSWKKQSPYIKALFISMKWLDKKFKPLRGYLNVLVLCIGTFAHGVFYLNATVQESVFSNLFPTIFGNTLALLMLVFPILKIVSIFNTKNKRLKKYFLMAILLIWLTITWGYFQSPIPNVGYLKSGMMVLFCYIELYRWEDGTNAEV